MFLKKTPNKSGRINLAIVDGYYDKATKKTKHKVIESMGYLDELVGVNINSPKKGKKIPHLWV